MPRGSITSQRSSAGTAVPDTPKSWSQILDEYPELWDDFLAVTANRDVGQPDKRSKAFESQYPTMRPRPY